MLAEAVEAIASAYRSIEEPPTGARAPAAAERACRACATGTVLLRDGHLVCGACDAVDSRHIDARPEWRSGTDVAQSDLARCGVEASDLYTNSVLGCTSTGADGRRAPRAGSWGGLAGKDRALYAQLTHMALCAGAGATPAPKAVLHAAQRMYKAVNDLPAARNTRRAGLAEGCVYAAYRSFGAARSVAEIAAMFGVPVTVVERGVIRVQGYVDGPKDPVRATEYVARFGSRVAGVLEDSTLAVVTRVLDTIETIGALSGNRPATVAATALALVAQTGGLGTAVTLQAVAEACGLSESTIARCLRELRPYAADILLVAADVESHDAA
jgi:transcription initiation factor TFIIIB Brf1 subunit/transcription initiation factor TFIIB